MGSLNYISWPIIVYPACSRTKTNDRYILATLTNNGERFTWPMRACVIFDQWQNVLYHCYTINDSSNLHVSKTSNGINVWRRGRLFDELTEHLKEKERIFLNSPAHNERSYLEFNSYILSFYFITVRLVLHVLPHLSKASDLDRFEEFPVRILKWYISDISTLILLQNHNVFMS